MRDLQDYIAKFVFEADAKELKAIKAEQKAITSWIKDHYKGVKKLEFSSSKTEEGKWIVDAPNGMLCLNKDEESFTNGEFEWGVLGNTMEVANNSKLTTLTGAPTECKYFKVSNCDNLISLEGAPRQVSQDFEVSDCKNLTTLEGSPELVGKMYMISNCPVKNLRFSPKNTRSFILFGSEIKDLEGISPAKLEKLKIQDCETLESLKGIPPQMDYLILRNLPNLEWPEGIKFDVKKEHICQNCPKCVEAKPKDNAAESAFMINGETKKRISFEELAEALGFNSVQELANSKHPILKQYTVLLEETDTQGIGTPYAQKHYNRWNIYLKGDMTGFESASEAKTECEKAGAKKSKSVRKNAGARYETSVHSLKIKSALESYIYFSSQDSHIKWQRISVVAV